MGTNGTETDTPNITFDDTKEIHYYQRSVILSEAPVTKAPEGYGRTLFQPYGLTIEWSPGSQPRTVSVHGILLNWRGVQTSKACDFIYSLDGNAPHWIKDIFKPSAPKVTRG